MRHDPQYVHRTRLRKLRVLRMHLADATRCADESGLVMWATAIGSFLAAVDSEIAREEVRLAIGPGGLQ